MKRPSNFNLMSHRQVINCPTALELCSLATEGTQEMKETKEMAIAYQSSAWNNFCTFCYFCGTYKKIIFCVSNLSKLVNAPRRFSNFANEIRTSFPWDLWSIEII